MAYDLDYIRRKLLAAGVSAGDADAQIKGIKDALAAAAAKSAASSTSSGIGGGTIKSLAEAAAAGFYDRFQNTTARISTTTIEKIVGKLADIPSLNPLTLLTNILKGGAEAAGTVLGDLAKTQDALLEQTKGAGGFVGTIGDNMIDSLRESMIAAVDMGATVNDFLVATESLMVNSERMAVYSDKTISSGIEASLAYTKTSRTLLENSESFRNVGLGLNDAAESIKEIGKSSIVMGLSAKATSETLIKNLGTLNQYGFQNGIKGLGKMVQEAQALKIDMGEIFKVADKVFDPEGAINMAANLQVVGGAFGDLADPIKLMYNATNNVESLQTSILGAARSLATYNQEQGRFEVTGVNLRRAKAMSDALGISMGELTNMAVKGAAKMEAMSQLDMFPNLEPEQKEFVSNLATMKDGRVGFDLPKDMAKQLGITNLVDGFVGLDQLGDEQIVKLQAIQKANEAMSTKEIARTQLNNTTQIMGTVSAIYLRMMDDARRTDTGVAIGAKMDLSSKFMKDNFDPASMTTGEMTKIAIEMAKKGVADSAEAMYETMKNSVGPDISNILEQGMKKATDVYNQYSPQATDLLKELEKKAEPVIEKGKELLRDLNVMVKVDINSNSTLLANMLVDEITKNPQAKANFVSILTQDNRAYS
jgi:hypothetical protein